MEGHISVMRIRRRPKNREGQRGNTISTTQYSQQRSNWWKVPLQIVPFFIIAAPVSLIFILSARSRTTSIRSPNKHQQSNTTIESAVMMGNCNNVDGGKEGQKQRPQIVYTDVTEIHKKSDGSASTRALRRYAAMEVCSNDEKTEATTTVPLSVLRWSYLVSSYDELTDGVTRIMKVSCCSPLEFMFLMFLSTCLKSSIMANFVLDDNLHAIAFFPYF